MFEKQLWKIVMISHDLRDLCEEIIGRIEDMVYDGLDRRVAIAVVWQLVNFVIEVDFFYMRGLWSNDVDEKIERWLNQILKALPRLPRRDDWPAFLQEIKSDADAAIRKRALDINADILGLVDDIQHVPRAVMAILPSLSVYVDVERAVNLEEAKVRICQGERSLTWLRSYVGLLHRAEDIAAKLEAKAPFGDDLLARMKLVFRSIELEDDWYNYAGRLEILMLAANDLLPSYGAWLDQQKRLPPAVKPPNKKRQRQQKNAAWLKQRFCV